jgi:hypothetical protein
MSDASSPWSSQTPSAAQTSTTTPELSRKFRLSIGMAAQKAGVALERVTSSVRLERQGDGPVTFKCSLSILGELSEEERAAVASAAAHCPVRRTLSRGIQFAFEAAPDSLLG